MKPVFPLMVLALLAMGSLGCTDFVDEVDQGGVLLNVDFGDSFFRVGVNNVAGAGLVALPSVTIDSVIVRPTGGSSSLMDVQIDTVEVTYSRADTGTRVPPALVYNVVGNVPAGGQLQFDGLPILSVEQLERPPLSDLLFQNGAVDRETGEGLIKLNITMRFFGRTVGGESVASQPRTQTFEFFPFLVDGGN